MMTASLFVVDLEACYKADSGYQVVTGTGERDLVSRFTASLANLLAIVTGRSLSSGHEQVAD